MGNVAKANEASSIACVMMYSSGIGIVQLMSLYFTQKYRNFWQSMKTSKYTNLKKIMLKH